MTDDQVAGLLIELERTARRLSDLGAARLSRPAAPVASGSAAPVASSSAAPVAPSPADAAFALVQHLADRSADHLGRPRREVPRLGDHAVADQLRVVGRDLLDDLAGQPTPPERWALEEIRAEIAAVARALP